MSVMYFQQHLFVFSFITMTHKFTDEQKLYKINTAGQPLPLHIGDLNLLLELEEIEHLNIFVYCSNINTLKL